MAVGVCFHIGWAWGFAACCFSSWWVRCWLAVATALWAGGGATRMWGALPREGACGLWEGARRMRVVDWSWFLSWVWSWGWCFPSYVPTIGLYVGCSADLWCLHPQGQEQDKNVANASGSEFQKFGVQNLASLVAREAVALDAKSARNSPKQANIMLKQRQLERDDSPNSRLQVLPTGVSVERCDAFEMANVPHIEIPSPAVKHCYVHPQHAWQLGNPLGTSVQGIGGIPWCQVLLCLRVG